MTEVWSGMLSVSVSVLCLVGLSELSLEEIKQMAGEMTDKFNRLSEELIANLQLRDILVGEMEAKNRYIITN